MRDALEKVKAAAGRLKVFPLPSAVLLPGGIMPLHVFEPRYKAMLKDAMDSDSVFAMAQGKVPFDAKVAAEQIEIVAMLNKLQFAAFVEGSDKGNTKAKGEIWTDKAKFTAAIAKSEEDVAKLAILGGSGVPLRELVGGLNALGVSPRDLIVILQALKASGALQADIEVM